MMFRCGIRILATAVFAALTGAAASMKADLQTALPDDWFTRAPTAERLAVVRKAAGTEGWTAVSRRLYAGAVRGYELRQEEAAAAWYHAARWGELFARPQAEAGRLWFETMRRAGGLHAGMRSLGLESLPDAPLVDLLSTDTVAWLLGDRAFSEAFFELLTAYDYLPQALRVLQMLRDADARRFESYAQLALAMALVYDSPPPSHWPHWQVSPDVLSRRLPAPVETFGFLADSDRRGATLHRLGRLSAAELKFAVDIAVTPAELVWAQRSVKFPLASLVQSYEAVRYRTDRIQAEQYVWPGTSYDLTEILREGGICVDQAYFATQTGKARGVPTLLFAGAGRDGRHAWFGYLGPGGKWMLDAGRYAEQRYVTGVAYDPQTWRSLSDHELVFLSEGFRRLPPYRQSRQHLVFAELYLRMERKPEAAEAARKAVGHERRNVEAWELLAAANDEAPARTREGLLREAARAMQRYPDLNARFVRELASSLRERGETSAADFEERAIARRGQTGGRTDLAVDQAVSLMSAAAPEDRMRVYRQTLQQYGREGGVDFFDRVAKPYVVELFGAGRDGEARQAIAYTRAVLKPEFGSQLERELAQLEKRAR